MRACAQGVKHSFCKECRFVCYPVRACTQGVTHSFCKECRFVCYPVRACAQGVKHSFCQECVALLPRARMRARGRVIVLQRMSLCLSVTPCAHGARVKHSDGSSVSSNLLILASPMLYSFLSDLFTVILRHGYMPESLRDCTLVPIP